MKSLDQIYRDQKSGKLTESVKKPLKEAYAKKASQVKTPKDFIDWLTQILEAEAVLFDALGIELFSDEGSLLPHTSLRDDLHGMMDNAFERAIKSLPDENQRKNLDRNIAGLLKRFNRSWLRKHGLSLEMIDEE